MKRLLILAFVISLVGCIPAKDVQNQDLGGTKADSGYEYGGGTIIPNDQKLYTIRGTLVDPPVNTNRQSSPGGAYISGYSSSGSGYVSGSAWGPEFKGKGILRIKVITSDCDIAPVGSEVVLKCSDQKAVVLGPGDTVTFKCRKQCEPIAPTADYQKISEADLTWELDYGRLASPVVKAG